jgi:hypothetical protein
MSVEFLLWRMGIVDAIIQSYALQERESETARWSDIPIKLREHSE